MPGTDDNNEKLEKLQQTLLEFERLHAEFTKLRELTELPSTMDRFLRFGKSVTAGIAAGVVATGFVNVIDVSIATRWTELDIADLVYPLMFIGAVIGAGVGIVSPRKR